MRDESRKRERWDVTAHECMQRTFDLIRRVWWCVTVQKLQNCVPPRKQERLCNDFEPGAQRLWFCFQQKVTTELQ